MLSNHFSDVGKMILKGLGDINHQINVCYFLCSWGVAMNHNIVPKAIELDEDSAEKLNAETLVRWQQEAETGKVVSHKSVAPWLDTWGTEEDNDKPE